MYRNVAYYEGFSFDRPCLYQDIRQVDSSLTHLHFAFATLDANNYSINTGNALSAYEFDNFRRLSGPLRILSFGGWGFSTAPSTYNIFREGVTAANRMAMATSIANFIHDNDLDGVDIDWEYPGVRTRETYERGRNMLTTFTYVGTRYSRHTTR
jgi:GH18 family chitinase